MGVRVNQSNSATVLSLTGPELDPAAGGTRTTVGAVQRWPVIQLADGATQDAVAVFSRIPGDWVTADIVAVWANGAAGSGDATFQPVYEVEAAGGTLDSGRVVGSNVNGTAGAVNVLVDTTVVSALNVAGARMVAVRLQRLGGTDSLNTAINIVAIELRRVS